MAGVMEEFDEATPMKRSYCRSLTEDEYEQQASFSTEKALEDLIKYLDSNSEEYCRILKKKKREEAEENGLMSYMKVKLWSYWKGEDSGFATPSKQECDVHLDKLKTDMMKAFSYSQECKGIRRSTRLAEKRKKSLSNQWSPSAKKCPCPPPPPPPPLPSPAPSVIPFPLTRRALSEKHNSRPKTDSQRPNKLQDASPVDDYHNHLMCQIAGSGLRKRLKKTTENRSPGGTPIGGWKKRRHHQPAIHPFFNHRLLEKFKGVRSPSPASPGRFDKSPP